MSYSPPDTVTTAAQPVEATPAARRPKKPRCDDCFFGANGSAPCARRSPAHVPPGSPGRLRPPQQLSFVFRQERRAEPFAFVPAQSYV